jgi:Xaa-Pro aminopeptidase
MPIIKTPQEIRSIQKACTITDEIFSEILKELQKGMYVTERQLSRAIDKKIKARGLRHAFPVIVASGAGAAEPHHKPTNEPLSGFTVIDFGVRVNGYCSDMTRTVYFGVPKTYEKVLYEKLLRSQLLGIRMVRDGASCAVSDLAVRTFLGAYRKYFIHTLGHGVGKRIHERPRIYYRSEKDVYQKNMVVTVEPGVYIEGKLGIRIEDTCVVTGQKPEILTKSTKTLHIFPKREAVIY